MTPHFLDTALVLAALQMLADHAAKALASEAGKAVWSQLKEGVQTLSQKVRDFCRDDAPCQKALSDFEAAPQEPERREALALEMERVAYVRPTQAADLAQFIQTLREMRAGSQVADTIINQETVSGKNIVVQNPQSVVIQ